MEDKPCKTKKCKGVVHPHSWAHVYCEACRFGDIKDSPLLAERRAARKLKCLEKAAAKQETITPGQSAEDKKAINQATHRSAKARHFERSLGITK